MIAGKGRNSRVAIVILAVSTALTTPLSAQDRTYWQSIDEAAQQAAAERAARVVDAMSGEDLVRLTWGIMPLPCSAKLTFHARQSRRRAMCLGCPRSASLH